jgi:hypothetical protein
MGGFFTATEYSLPWAKSKDGRHLPVAVDKDSSPFTLALELLCAAPHAVLSFQQVQFF